MTNDEVEKLQLGFRALAHETRLKIVMSLPYEGTELHADLIGRILGIKPSTCSKHLGILARAGILNSYRSGQYVNYRVNQDRLRELHSFIEHLLPPIERISE